MCVHVCMCVCACVCVCVKWGLTVVLIYISIVANDAEHLFICLLVIRTPLQLAPPGRLHSPRLGLGGGTSPCWFACTCRGASVVVSWRRWEVGIVKWIMAQMPQTPGALTETYLAVVPSLTSDSLEPHGLQDVRLPCPSLSPRVCSNSCPLSRWCHIIILSSAALFSFGPQYFLASGSFPMRLSRYSWINVSLSLSFLFYFIFCYRSLRHFPEFRLYVYLFMFSNFPHLWLFYRKIVYWALHDSI